MTFPSSISRGVLVVQILLSAILSAALFASCTGTPVRQIVKPPETPRSAPSPAEKPVVPSYTIMDYKYKTDGRNMPEWVSFYFEGGLRKVESLGAYEGCYVFISRSEGNSFNALNHWKDGFSPELDFPRLAAARIETRFSAAVPYPDEEYGSFFEALIRTASDAPWTGAVREDDFWVRLKISSGDDEPEIETWGFLILVTIEKTLFASQLNALFQNIKPNPQPSRNQITAANRVKDRFFEGF